MPDYTPAQGFRVPVSTDDPDVVDDIHQLADQIEKRVMGVYASAAARDSATAAAGVEAGMFAFTLSDHKMWYYNGSAWMAYPASFPTITTSTSSPSGGVDGDIWFKV